MDDDVFNLLPNLSSAGGAFLSGGHTGAAPVKQALVDGELFVFIDFAGTPVFSLAV